MYENLTITVVLPAYNEGKNISKFIKDIEELGIVDQIVAVNNNSNDNTEDEIKKNKVIYLNAEIQGFGAAVKKGIYFSKTDLIIICEPDGSFKAKDILKMMKYKKDFDAVFTSRTGDIKNFYLKYGNIIYAKILSLIFNGPKLSDVGSSLRLFNKKDLDKFKNKLNSDGPELQIELTINLIKQKIKIIEIPIEYTNRIGKSNYTGSFYSSLIVALRFTKVVLKKIFNFI